VAWRDRGYRCCRETDDRSGCVRRAPLLTRKEAAARLHVSASTMIRLGRSGAITEVRVARTVRIDPTSVERYIRSRSGPRAQQQAA
jgi:excisionase family DNA binding protein